MERISPHMVERQLELLEPLAHRFGLLGDNEHFVLQKGSRTNGIAWRLGCSKDGDYAFHNVVMIDNFLGMDARTAHLKLVTIRDVLLSVAHLQDQAKRKARET